MDLCDSLGMLLKRIFHQKTSTEKQVVISSWLEEVDSSSSSKFIWKIENFSKLSPEGLCSDVFTIGGCKWKVVLYPEKEVYDNYFAMLELVDGERPSTDLLVEFSLVITSQTDKKDMIMKECSGQLLNLTELFNPDKGYIVNDTCIFEVRISCIIKQGDDLKHDDGKEHALDGGDTKSGGESRDYPCAGQPFEEIIDSNSKDLLWESSWDEEDDLDGEFEKVEVPIF